MLPNMFRQDFGDQINRYVTLKSICYFTSFFFFLKYHNSFHINNYQEEQLILQLFSEYLVA